MFGTRDPGPFLLIATLCKEATHGEAGQLTGLVEIASQVQIRAAGPNAPDQMAPFRVELKAVILLIAGEGRGKRFKVELQPEDPSGKRLSRGELTIKFLDHEEATASIVVDYGIDIDQEGIYWIDVGLSPDSGGASRLLTRIPLRVTYQRTTP